MPSIRASLVRALVHSRLDYCNGILANAPLGLVGCLQSVLRSAARLVLRLPPRASVTQLMRVRLHWLPVQQRITFKMCILAFKCSHGHLCFVRATGNTAHLWQLFV